MNESGRKIVTLDDLERRHLQGHNDPYWQWIRLVVTLSTGSLTALVSLQGHYVPKHPVLAWVLVLAWAAHALAIASGLLALRWSYRGPLHAAYSLRRLRQTQGDEAAKRWVTRGRQTRVPAWHRWSVQVMTASFLLALVALCWFSAANLLR